VVDPAGRTWPVTFPLTLDPAVRRGRVLTAPHLVGDPQEKRQLGERHGALAVEMESAGVAAWCQERGVPFGGLRAVSDDAATGLSPELLGVLAGGRVRPGRLLRALVRRPGLLGELRRLAADTGAAARRLGRALSATLAAGRLPQPSAFRS